MSCSYLWTRGFSDFWALNDLGLIVVFVFKISFPYSFLWNNNSNPLFSIPLFFNVENSGTHTTPTPNQPKPRQCFGKIGLLGSICTAGKFGDAVRWEHQAAPGLTGGCLRVEVGLVGGWLVVWLVDFGKGVLDWDRTLVAGFFFVFFCFFWGAPWIFLRKQRCFKFQASDFFFNNCSCILPLKGAKSWQVVSTSIKCSKGGVIIMLVFGCRGWTFFDFGGLLLLDRPSGWLYRCRRSQLVVGNKWWKVAIMAVNWAKSLRLTPTYLLSVLQTLQISEKHWKTFPHVILL